MSARSRKQQEGTWLDLPARLPIVFGLLHTK